MPGVPSGRACEGCRKQKKKCDEVKPTCSRCARLGLVCVGSGQRRYKFKQENRFLQDGNEKRNAGAFSALNEQDRLVAGDLITVPSSFVTKLAYTFIQTIKLSTDLRFNLWWAYGSYLEDVPQRLGINEALDASAHALMNAHSDFCVHQVVSTKALAKYCRALNVLRVCLDDPEKASTSETLCAVALLLICQAFVSTQETPWTGHAEGAAQILKARKHIGPRDGFERKLLLSLRGPVVFEGLLNDKINMSSSEWEALVENELDKTTCEGQMMRSLAKLPNIMQRGRRMLRGMHRDTDLITETRSQYESLRVTLTELQTRLAEIQPFNANKLKKKVFQLLLAHYQRTYALGLSIGIVSNLVLRAIDTEDSRLVSESTYFSKEIAALAEHAQPYRPLGSSYMTLCLMAAWIGTTERQLRLSIEKALRDYQQDFPQSPKNNLTAELERTSSLLRLLPQSYCLDKHSRKADAATTQNFSIQYET